MTGLIAVIQLGFDPLLALGPLTIRWQTIGVTCGLLVALAVAALLIPARSSSPRDGASAWFPEAPSADAPERPISFEDMVLILVGIVPGAVVGGRLVHVVDYLAAYAANPISVVDPRVGTLSLLGAVVGGTLSGMYVAYLRGVSVRRAVDLAAVPLMLAIGLGKLAQLLGGSGQGLPFDGPWAVAFTGDGPWVSAAPGLPAHPSQVYEGAWMLLGIPIILLLAGARRRPMRVHPYVAWADRLGIEGRLFVGALAWFLAGRVLVGFTWRDAPVVGPLNMEQLLALFALAGIVIVAWLRINRRLTGALGLALCLAGTIACGGQTSPITPVASPPPASATAAPVGRPSAVPSAAPGASPIVRVPTPTPSPAQTDATIDDLISRMSVDEKIGQLFMVSFYGAQAEETDPAQVRVNRSALGVDNIAQAIARYHLGGVIYFDWAGNMVSVGQVAQLSNAIQAAGAAQPFGVPLLISTDQEGGSIVRLPTPATQFPGNMALGAAGQPDLAQSTGVAIAEELSAVGINQALAPDGDVNVNPANPIIGIRSFGSDPTLVADMTGAMVSGFQSVPGVAATVKHFPGHGDTDIDSHSQLPTISHSLDQWTQIDKPPFATAIADVVDVVMVGHLAFPALDPTGTPASLSAPILGDVLRGQLGFKGVVMTDALGMGALRKTYGDDQIPVLAVLAGEDILLMPVRLSVAYSAVQAAVRSGQISSTRLDASVRRILQLKQRLGLFGAAPVSVAGASSVVGSRAHRALEARDAEASVTLLANDGALLPLTSASAQGSYLIVGPVAAPVASMASAVRGRGLSVTTFVSGTSPPASVIASAAAQAAAFGTLIVLTLNADGDTGQQRLVGALAATGKPLITVSIGRPYDQAYYRAAVNLCLYSSSPASLRAVTRVILGDVNPAGRLPVMIPVAGSASEVLYPLGYGLSYSP